MPWDTPLRTLLGAPPATLARALAGEMPAPRLPRSHGVRTDDRMDTGAEPGPAGNPRVPGYGPVFRPPACASMVWRWPRNRQGS